MALHDTPYSAECRASDFVLINEPICPIHGTVQKWLWSQNIEYSYRAMRWFAGWRKAYMGQVTKLWLSFYLVYQLIAKPGNKTAAVSWPDPYNKKIMSSISGGYHVYDIIALCRFHHPTLSLNMLMSSDPVFMKLTSLPPHSPQTLATGHFPENTI